MKYSHFREESRQLSAKSLPGIITGGADNDPAGISTYSISGATYGLSQIWLMILAIPMLIAVQAMCARVGDIKKTGLSNIFKAHFHPFFAWLATFGLIFANVFTIGADIVGMSAVIGLITGVNYRLFVVPLTILIWYMVVFLSYRKIMVYFEWLILFFFAYVFSAFLAKPNWGRVLESFVWPGHISLGTGYWIAAVGILGTTITPYLFYWQTKEEVEEDRTQAEAKQEARHADFYNAPGFLFSQVITIFIMVSTAATIFTHGQTINTAVDAAAALAPIAGPLAKYLFAVGILGAGLLAVPILASSTAYVVAETAGWKNSLDDHLSQDKGFYGVITLSLLAGVVIMFFGLDPIKGLFYSQVADGVIGPLLIILILLIANDKKIMGKYVNGWFDNLFGWMSVVIMIVATLVMFYQMIF